MKKINIIGSISTILALGFVVYVNFKQNNIGQKKVVSTEKPISQPVDMVMDSVNMDCGDSKQWD